MIDIKRYQESTSQKNPGYSEKNQNNSPADGKRQTASTGKSKHVAPKSGKPVTKSTSPDAELDVFFDIIDIDSTEEPAKEVPAAGIINLYEPKGQNEQPNIESNPAATGADSPNTPPLNDATITANKDDRTADKEISDYPETNHSGTTEAAPVVDLPDKATPDPTNSINTSLPAPSQDFDLALAASDVQNLVPVGFACRYKIVPLGHFNDKTQIAIADPTNISLLDEIRWVLGTEIELLKAAPQKIEEWLRLVYGVGAETVGQILGDKSEEAYIDLNAQLTTDLDEESEEASIIKFVNALLLESLQARATDIHIEPFDKLLRIRHRFDGILYEIPVPSALQHLHQSIVSRIKIMAN